MGLQYPANRLLISLTILEIIAQNLGDIWMGPPCRVACTIRMSMYYSIAARVDPPLTLIVRDTESAAASQTQPASPAEQERREHRRAPAAPAGANQHRRYQSNHREVDD